MQSWAAEMQKERSDWNRNRLKQVAERTNLEERDIVLVSLFIDYSKVNAFSYIETVDAIVDEEYRSYNCPIIKPSNPKAR